MSVKIQEYMTACPSSGRQSSFSFLESRADQHYHFPMIDNFWDRNAKNWNEVISLGTIESRQVTNPEILSAILRQKPKSVLDVGCGEGWICKEMQSRQIPYMGVDGSKNLIDIATSKHGSFFKKVSYQEISDGIWRPQKKFDIVVFNFSLMDESISGLLQSAASFLSMDGAILIQTLHPSFVFQDGWKAEDFKAMAIPFDGTMPWYGRTLDSWKRLFCECGLELEKMTEPRSGNAFVSIVFELKPF